ncbi:MAG TPA: hypothetical protein RMH80_18045, partial [Polyangiaceae bacterium LLY-WYZ-15_(1-7)]|nr:hypothetical protein [Polyangiaceae bacterium LLY-WYZ-15_(1-7)]
VRATRRAFIRTAQRRVIFERSGAGVLVVSSSGFQGVGGALRWDLRSALWSVRVGPGEMYDANRFALFPDDRALAFVRVGEDGAALLLREDSGDTLLAPGEAITRLSVAPSGATVLAQEGNTLRLLDPQAPEDDHLGLAGEGMAWAYRPTGGALAVVSREGPLRLLDPRDGRTLHELELPTAEPAARRGIGRLRWSADGRLLLVERDGSFHLVDGWTGRLRGTLPRPEELYGLALAPDGSALYLSTGDALLPIPVPTAPHEGPPGELEAGEPIALPRGRSLGLLAVGPGGRLAGASGADIHVRPAGPGAEWRTVSGGAGETSVWGVRWAPDGRTLATWGRAGVELWGAEGVRSTGCDGTGVIHFPRAASGDEGDDGDGAGEGDPSPGAGLYLQGAGVCDLGDGSRHATGTLLAASADGRRLLVDRDGTLGTLAASDLEAEPAPLRLPRRGREACRYGACLQRHALDADGDRVALPIGDDVWILDADRGRRVGRIRGRDAGELLEVALSPDGERVLLLRRDPNASQDVVVELHDVRGRRKLRASMGMGPVRHAFSEDGTLLAAATAREVQLFGTGAGQARGTGPSVSAVASVHVGTGEVVVRGPEALRILELDGSERQSLTLPLQFDVTPDGQRVAACHEGQLEVRDLLAGRREARGPCRASDELRWAPGGALLAHRQGALTRVHRPFSPDTLTLRTYRESTPGGVRSMPAAHDEEGRFLVAVSALDRFRYRAPGPLATAELRPAITGPRTASLVADFFGGATATRR